MKILIQGGRVLDPQSNTDAVADVAISAGKIVAIGKAPEGFQAQKTIDAKGCIVMPGLVDLSVRLKEPGHDPVLDEPGLVEMLRFKAEKLNRSKVMPLGALTRGLKGEILTEMVQLTEAGCVGFSQAEVALENTQVLQRALQYANSFGYTVWLRPQELHLGKGVAASGPLATRMGLSGVPVAAETIALHTIFELLKSTKAHVHLCRISSAAGVALVRQAKAASILCI
jgi:dihydroorotase